MIVPTWKPQPKVFGSIDEVISYCEDYIVNTLYKPGLNLIESEKDALDHSEVSMFNKVSDETFAKFCSPIVPIKASLLLIRLAAKLTISDADWIYLCNVVPAYIDNDHLLRFRPNYPLEYAQSEKVKFREPYGNYTIKYYKDLVFKSKPSEDRIRHFRIEELFGLTNIVPLLGDANDGRYTELELCGLILWLYMSKPPVKFMDIFLPILRSSSHGLELRARLKPYSVSVKRWPDYWLPMMGVIEPLIEVESIFGYIIVETVTDDLLSDLDDRMALTPVNYYASADQFMYDLNRIIENWVDVPNRPVKNILLEEFFNSWELWTTPGAASDFRAKSSTGTKLRVKKSALPLFTTIAELYEGRLQPSRTAIKAEPGKSRLVFAAPTYDSIAVSYLLYKYDGSVQSSSTGDFFAMSQEQSLNTCAQVIDILSSKSEYLGSSDVERNDHIQNVVFDMYMFVRLLAKVILPEDVVLLLDLCSRTTINWIFIPNVIMKSKYATFSDKRGTHLVGQGGLITGQRRTTLYNGFFNRSGNSLARLLVERTVTSPGPQNLFGGDDSLQRFDSHFLGALTYIAATTICVIISPLKSFISKSAAEFFRVGYSSELRFGYSNRVIHSIVAHNPVSQQEIDITSKLKSMYNTLQIFFRRSQSADWYNVWEIYFSRLSIPRAILSAPVSAGGCGLGPPTTVIVTPGIPRYNQGSSIEKPSTWFVDMSPHLNPYNLPGVLDSYRSDMSKGVVDREATKLGRRSYKTAVDFWLGKVKFKATTLIDVSGTASVKAILSKFEFDTMMSSTINKSLMAATSSWQKSTKSTVKASESIRIIDRADIRLISDIINRAEFDKVNDKITFLVDQGLVELKNNIKNRLPGKVLLDLTLGSISPNSMQTSVPTDMNFVYDIIQTIQQSTKASYVSASLLASSLAMSIHHMVTVYYWQLLRW